MSDEQAAVQGSEVNGRPYSPTTPEDLQKMVESRVPLPPIGVPIPNDHYRHPISNKVIPSVNLAEEAVRTLLRFIGEDPDRDGLKETPRRVVKALREMTVGYSSAGPEAILSKVFEQSCDEVIVVRGIPFCSYCEHHMMVFSGTVDIGYLPSVRHDLNGTTATRVVGLSKLARLVDLYAKRLQIQERMTQQIATAIHDTLAAQGAGVVVKAEHSCLACRGAAKSNTEMVTSCMLGVFRKDATARGELLDLFRK